MGAEERRWDEAVSAWKEGDAPTRQRARLELCRRLPRVHPAAWTQARVQAAGILKLCPPEPVPEVGRMEFPVVAEGQDRFVAVRIAADGTPRFTDPDWAGRSCELAVELARHSRAVGLAVSPLWSATGCVEGGRIEPVDGLERKIALWRRERPLGRLIIPRRGAPGSLPVGVHAVETLAEAIALLRLPAEDPHVELDGLGRMAESQPVEAARRALRLWEAPHLDPHERVLLAGLILAAANHEAEAEVQARWAEEVRARVEDGMDEDLARALGSLAVAWIDALRTDGVADLLAGGSSLRGHLRVHIDGPLALLRTMEGRFEEALALRRQNLQRATVAERPRCTGDLADALLRLGRAEEALELLDQALALPPARAVAYFERTRPYLHLHRARACHALGINPEEDLARVPRAHGLDPKLRAELDAAEWGLGDLPDRAKLPDSPIVEALWKRCLARRGEAAAAAWMMERLGGADLDEACRRLPY